MLLPRQADSAAHTIGETMSLSKPQASETSRANEVKKDRKQQFDESKAKNRCFFCKEFTLTLHCVEIKRSMFKSEDYDELFTGGPYSVCKARACLRKWITIKGTYEFEQGSLVRTAPSLIWLAKHLKKDEFAVLGRLP